jgi:hypothetical protein
MGHDGKRFCKCRARKLESVRYKVDQSSFTKKHTFVSLQKLTSYSIPSTHSVPAILRPLHYTYCILPTSGQAEVTSRNALVLGIWYPHPIPTAVYRISGFQENTHHSVDIAFNIQQQPTYKGQACIEIRVL